MDNNGFERFEKLRSIFKSNLLGFPVNYLLQGDIIEYVYNNNIVLPKSGLKSFIFQHFTAFDYSDFIPDLYKFQTVLTLLHNRKDYWETVSKVQSEIKDSTIFQNYNKNRKIIDIYNIKNILRVVIIIIYMYSRRRITLIEKKHFSIKLANYINTIFDIENRCKKEPFKTQQIILFNATYGLDTMLSFFFKRHNVKIYSLQHGLLCKYKKFIPYDIINFYIPPIINNYLAWGKQSKTLIKGYTYPIEKVVICGNPKFLNQPPLPLKSTFKNCLLLLSRFIYDKENRLLLHNIGKFAKTYNINVYVKPHPSLYTHVDWNEYLKIIDEYNINFIDSDKTLIEILNSDICDFSIVYNSGSYVESYFYGLPSFRYTVGENDYIAGLDDRFSDERSLINQIEAAKQKLQSENYQKEVNEFINDVLGYKEQGYHFLNSNI